ncbi:MAG: hypothetical protein QI223_09945 [Candidatus Korarchaeota archaeon]|nr:hypothetical protein [Candidatus Korarchaeota archaeon]
MKEDEIEVPIPPGSRGDGMLARELRKEAERRGVRVVWVASSARIRPSDPGFDEVALTSESVVRLASPDWGRLEDMVRWLYGSRKRRE